MRCFTCGQYLERENLWYRCRCGDARHVDEVVHILETLSIIGMEGEPPPVKTRIWKTFSGKSPELLYIGDVEDNEQRTGWREVCRSLDRKEVLEALKAHHANQDIVREFRL